MASVPFKAKAGLEVEGDLKLATLSTGTPATSGKILSLSSFASETTMYESTFNLHKYSCNLLTAIAAPPE